MIQYTALPANKTALLIIDVQRALFTRPTPVYEDRRMIGVIKGLVELAHLYHCLVIYIQHSNKSFLKEGTDGFKLHPSLKPDPKDLETLAKMVEGGVVTPPIDKVYPLERTGEGMKYFGEGRHRGKVIIKVSC